MRWNKTSVLFLEGQASKDRHCRGEEKREEEEIMAAPGGDGCSSNGYNEKIKYLQGKRPELVNFH